MYSCTRQKSRNTYHSHVKSPHTFHVICTCMICMTTFVNTSHSEHSKDVSHSTSPSYYKYPRVLMYVLFYYSMWTKRWADWFVHLVALVAPAAAAAAAVEENEHLQNTLETTKRSKDPKKELLGCPFEPRANRTYCGTKSFCHEKWQKKSVSHKITACNYI